MRMPRSFLFVPGDSERKLAKGEASSAHALILDLEDSVAEQNLPAARQLVRAYLDAHRDRTRQQVWVRINPLDSAKAAAVQPLDTVSPNFRDLEAFGHEVRRARMDGFTGKLAIHPDQVAVINSGFRPSEDEIAHARAVVAALNAVEGGGVAQVNGM